VSNSDVVHSATCGRTGILPVFGSGHGRGRPCSFYSPADTPAKGRLAWSKTIPLLDSRDNLRRTGILPVFGPGHGRGRPCSFYSPADTPPKGRLAWSKTIPLLDSRDNLRRTGILPVFGSGHGRGRPCSFYSPADTPAKGRLAWSKNHSAPRFQRQPTENGHPCPFLDPVTGGDARAPFFDWTQHPHAAPATKNRRPGRGRRFCKTTKPESW
jgi:hypothetical protein